MSIKLKDLSFTYNKKSPFETHALKNISMEIEDGEFFAIIGHTGSGKSTLVQHFNALIKAMNGEIVVNGIDLRQKKPDYKALRKDVGMVFQYPEYQLFGETVEKDVAFGLINFYGKQGKKGKKALIGLSEFEISQRVKEALEMVGLDYEYIKNRSPFELSGGQKRRVAIAGIIVTKPKILMLDEPTAGLDPIGKKEILELIHKLQKNCSPTIIIVSHDMDEVAENATKVAVMNKGKVETILPPDELFKDYEKIKELGMDVPISSKIWHALKNKGIDVAYSTNLSILADNVAQSMKGGRM